jgi:hypothetical protein
MTGGCCPNTDDGCDGCFECVENTCTAVEDCCATDDDCGACQECEGGFCVDLNDCCTNDDDCGACQECEGGACVDLANCCERDDDCDTCQECEGGLCVDLNDCCETDNDCDSDEVCCSGICVEEHIGCCREFGDYCGVTDVASAGGDDRQYDCCDGLLCCFGQSTNVCGECCADSDCKAAPGGVCNHFQCEYPTCEGKYDACGSDSDCCHGLKCFGGVCKHPHHPHPKPTPPAPVTSLPATGVKNGSTDSSGAVGITLVAGAAALLGAKMLRQKPQETNEEA